MRSTRHTSRMAWFLCLFTLLAESAFGQINRENVDQISDVGITEHRGEFLPLDCVFRDHNGQRVRLGDYFDGALPVIVSFNYTDCPMLCKLQLKGLVEGLKDVSWTAGEHFRVLSVSIDPSETVQQAAVAHQRHVQDYGRPETGDGWSFLTGAVADIRRVTSAAGFKYRYLPKEREYSHAAAAILCTPDGRISRYLYGIQFDPDTLKLAITEAGEGQIGSALDQLLLFCFRYDETSGRYSVAAWTLMRIAALVTLSAIGLFVVPFWLRSTSRTKSDVKTGAEESDAEEGLLERGHSVRSAIDLHRARPRDPQEDLS
jgi:protein SCO1/2